MRKETGGAAKLRSLHWGPVHVEPSPTLNPTPCHPVAKTPHRYGTRLSTRARAARSPTCFFDSVFAFTPTHTPPPLDWRLSTPPITAGHARNPTLRHIAPFCPPQVPDMIDRTARTDFVYDVDEAHRYIMNVKVRVLVSVISLWGRWRVASLSHTPTPAESPSYPRAQDELVAPSARSGDRGVREWGSSRKARVGTCFFSGARESALSPPGAPGRREGAHGVKPKSAPLGAAHLSQARPRQPSHPARKISLSLKRVSGSVHKLRHRTFPQRSGLSHHCTALILERLAPG